MRNTGWVLLWALLLVSPAQAELYKWVDKDGSVNYGDDPPPGVKAEPLGDRGAVTVVPAMPVTPRAAPSSQEVRDQRLDRLEQELANERAARRNLEEDTAAREAADREAAIARCRAARNVDCEDAYERERASGITTERILVVPGRGYHPSHPSRDPDWGVRPGGGGFDTSPHRPRPSAPPPQTPPVVQPRPPAPPLEGTEQGISRPSRPAAPGNILPPGGR